MPEFGSQAGGTDERDDVGYSTPDDSGGGSYDDDDDEQELGEPTGSGERPEDNPATGSGTRPEDNPAVDDSNDPVTPEESLPGDQSPDSQTGSTGETGTQDSKPKKQKRQRRKEKQARKSRREEVAEDVPGVEPDEVKISDEGEVGISGEGLEDARRAQFEQREGDLERKAEREAAAGNPRLDPKDVQADVGPDGAVDVQLSEQGRSERKALWQMRRDIGSAAAGLQARQEAIERAETQATEQLQERFGDEFTPGEEFTVEAEQTDQGFQAQTELTEQGVTQLTEERITEQTGVPLDRGEDFTVERSDDGQINVELTDQGRIEVAGQKERGQTALDQAIEDFEAETGVDVFGGEGDVVQSVEAELREAAVTQQVGQGLIPSDEQVSETATVGEGGETLVEETSMPIGGSVPTTSTLEGTLRTVNINPAATALGAGQAAEFVGESTFNVAATDRGERAAAVTSEDPDDLDAQTEGLRENLDAGASGTEKVVDATAEAVTERPEQTFGSLAAITAVEIGGGLAVGAGAKRALTATRGRLATRGMDFQGSVDFKDIERPDVASGQSRLTRFSTDAVPDGGRSMNPDDFPAETAPRDPAQELRNLADEFDDPEVRDALNAAADERTLFSARSGTKDPTFEPSSGRPYDPDAAFFAGSVSRNFLDVEGTPSSDVLSGGVRRPRPIEAGRSLLRAADQEQTPTIVATAGRVEELPDDVRSRGEITDYLQEQRNTDRFFVRQPDNQSGEAEALVSAEGAESTTDPWRGSGRVEPGEATTFVEVDDPLRTSIGGERVPIQVFRQQTGDVDVRTRGVTDRFRRFLDDDRGQVDLGSTRRSTTDVDVDASRTVRELGDEVEGSSLPYQPGGRPGTPFVPSPVPSSDPSGTDVTGTTVSPTAASSPVESSPAVSPTAGLGSPIESGFASPVESGFGSPTSPVGGGGFGSGFGGSPSDFEPFEEPTGGGEPSSQFGFGGSEIGTPTIPEGTTTPPSDPYTPPPPPTVTIQTTNTPRQRYDFEPETGDREDAFTRFGPREFRNPVDTPGEVLLGSVEQPESSSGSEAVDPSAGVFDGL